MRGHPASQFRVQSQQELSESKFPVTRILECFWCCGTRDRIVALVSISKDRQHYKPRITTRRHPSFYTMAQTPRVAADRGSSHWSLTKARPQGEGTNAPRCLVQCRGTSHSDPIPTHPQACLLKVSFFFFFCNCVLRVSWSSQSQGSHEVGRSQDLAPMRGAPSIPVARSESAGTLRVKVPCHKKS